MALFGKPGIPQPWTLLDPQRPQRRGEPAGTPGLRVLMGAMLGLMGNANTQAFLWGTRVQTRPVAGVLSREVSRALSTCIALAGVALLAHQRLEDLSPLCSSRSSKNRTKQKILMLIQQRPTVTQCQLVNYPFQCILKFIDVLCFL